MSIIVSYLDPVEAMQVETVEKFVKEMVNRGWAEKKGYESIKHLTSTRRYDISDKEYSITAWNNVHGGSDCVGYMFCLGGEREISTPLNATFMFRDDPTSQLIDNNAPLRNDDFLASLSAVAATVDSYGRLRTFGGFNGQNAVSQCYITPMARDRRKCNQKFNWTPSGRLLKASCFASACTTSDGHILLTGGGSSLFQGATVTANTCIQMNSGSSESTLKWKQVSPMQHLRCGHSSAVLPSGKVIVTGGYAGGMDYLTSAESYDVFLDRWVPVAPMNFPRSGFGFGVSANGALYSYGGSSNGSNGQDTVEMFDERVGKWVVLPQKMKSGRGYMGGCVGGGSGCLYAAGGVRDYDPQCSVECMDPRTNEWMYMHPDPEPVWIPGASEDTYETYHFSRTNFTMIYSMS